MPDAVAPTERFSNRVDDYHRHRPGFPATPRGWLRHSPGIDPGHEMADSGGGIGISTRMWLDAGHALGAVEPDDAMRAPARIALAAYPGLRRVTALFECQAAKGRVDSDYDTRAFVGTLG